MKTMRIYLQKYKQFLIDNKFIKIFQLVSILISI